VSEPWADPGKIKVILMGSVSCERQVPGLISP
jgi:hypothetical protein